MCQNHSSAGISIPRLIVSFGGRSYGHPKDLEARGLLPEPEVKPVAECTPPCPTAQPQATTTPAAPAAPEATTAQSKPGPVYAPSDAPAQSMGEHLNNTGTPPQSN